MKTSEDTFFSIKPAMQELKGPFKKESIYSLIDTSKLKLKEKEDVFIIIKMLYIITRKALVSNFKYESRQRAREEYIKQIEYLKYGSYQQ